MKIKNVLLLAVGAAAGYVLGTRAGRARFEQIKSRANTVAHDIAADPKVRSTVSNVAEQVKQHADVAPGPVSGLIRSAADQVKTTMDKPADPISAD